jgi:hypothetical protein
VRAVVLPDVDGRDLFLSLTRLASIRRPAATSSWHSCAERPSVARR